MSRTGILPLSFTLDHAGPMAWTVEDCAILLQAMVGHDRADPASANLSIPDYRAELAGGIKDMSIGVIRHFYERDTTVTPEVGAAMEASTSILSRLGASVRDVTLPPLHDWQACCMIIMLAEAYAVHEPWLRRPPGFEPLGMAILCYFCNSSFPAQSVICRGHSGPQRQP